MYVYSACESSMMNFELDRCKYMW